MLLTVPRQSAFGGGLFSGKEEMRTAGGVCASRYTSNASVTDGDHTARFWYMTEAERISDAAGGQTTPKAYFSTTTHGSPCLFRASMNGSGSSCSMLYTPLPDHLPVTIIMAPIMAGTPVVYEMACDPTSR